MATPITPNAAAGDKAVSKAAFKPAKVAQILAQLDADITALDGTPTAAEQRAILKRCLQRQKQMIKYLASHLQNGA